MKNRFLKLFVACMTSVGIAYIFDTNKFDTSDFILSIIFGISMWILLIIQRKI